MFCHAVTIERVKSVAATALPDRVTDNAAFGMVVVRGDVDWSVAVKPVHADDEPVHVGDVMLDVMTLPLVRKSIPVCGKEYSVQPVFAMHAALQACLVPTAGFGTSWFSWHIKCRTSDTLCAVYVGLLVLAALHQPGPVNSVAARRFAAHV